MPILLPTGTLNPPTPECTACGSTMTVVFSENDETTDYMCEACGHRWEEYNDADSG